MTDYSTELHAAREFAELGGRIAMGHYRRDPEKRQKRDGTWVTEADWAVEAQIRLRLARTFPGHNILGEEEGLRAAGGGAPVDGAPTWVVDPIDGTHNYMTGIPVWGVLIGLREGDESVVGVCHAPALGETYWAARGAGAYMNGDPISIDPLNDLARATFAFTVAGRWGDRRPGFDALTERTWQARGYGDFWGHMLVARGAVHVMAEPTLNVWDFTALEPIVAEAGGRITTFDGDSPADKGSCLSTNGVLHDEVMSLLGTR